MNRTLHAFPFDGINTDSMGHYLAGLGLLAATSRHWPTIRACWHRGRFMLLSDQIADIAEIHEYLLNQWTYTNYQRWWEKPFDEDRATVKKKLPPKSLNRARGDAPRESLAVLDATVVVIDRPIPNPLFGALAGKVSAQRNFENAHNAARQFVDVVRSGKFATKGVPKKLLPHLRALKKRQDRHTAGTQWLNQTLYDQVADGVPEIGSTGTWFGFANRTYNSGQEWYREGHISPWSFLLSMEGAFLLIGGVNRRLGSRSRPYAVFPFVSDPSQPETDGEIGLARAEFWAPLWKNPATLGEVETLLQRGLARIGGRAAQAPHEFTVAAMAAGVDAGVTEFARYELRQTTSSQVFEAIPREHIVTDHDSLGASQKGNRFTASNLLVDFIESHWLDHPILREPRDSKQKGKFVGLRGPIEAAIVRIGERPDDPTRWQALLQKLANAQARIDRNKNYRERCAALRPLDPAWFDLAWRKSYGIPVEIEMARAIASIGWPHNTKAGDVPLLANVFGVEVVSNQRPVRVQFPKARTAQAVWGNGAPLQLLLDVAHRRLIDAEKPTSKPFAASCFCSSDAVHRLLRGDGSIDLEEVMRWVPALSLIDWSRSPRLGSCSENSAESFVEPDGTILLQALARPLFHGRKLVIRNDATREPEPLFPQKLEPMAGLLRRVFNLLRFNSLDEAIQVLRDRYLAAGRDIVMPPSGFEANGELVAASLLIPISDQAVVSGFRRWLQPSKRRSN